MMMTSDEEKINHIKAVVKAKLADDDQRTFKIIDTCRTDNGLVLHLNLANFEDQPSPQKMVAFVPSAGASSRYFADLVGLAVACDKADQKVFFSEVKKFVKSDGQLPFKFPPKIKEIFSKGEATEDDFKVAQSEIRRAKAFQIAREDGSTFLSCKLREHVEIGGLSEQIFVIAPQAKSDFLKFLKATPQPIPASVVLQGESQSTYRFDDSGELILTEGKPVLVPAGHGALYDTLAELGNRRIQSFFIRNVDNLLSPVRTRG